MWEWVWDDQVKLVQLPQDPLGISKAEGAQYEASRFLSPVISNQPCPCSQRGLWFAFTKDLLKNTL